jgi:hypothetical protein
LEKIRRVEILHPREGECQVLLFTGWLSSALGWHPEWMERTEKGRTLGFAGPSGEVRVELVPDASGASLGQVRLFSEELTFQIQASCHGERATKARSTVEHGDELVGERAVHLGCSDVGLLLGEELKLLGRDAPYESALVQVVRMLNS